MVDDQMINLEILEHQLSPEYHVNKVASGEEALRLCSLTTAPDIILLDVMMPGIDGHEVCRRLRLMPAFVDIPIIFVTSQSTDEEQLLCWEAGGSDFVEKPVNADTLKRRMQTHVNLKLQTDFYKEQVFVDAATGIYNRLYLNKEGDKLFKLAKRTDEPFSIIMLDVDNFKRLNDSLGHIKGDECLHQLASTMVSLLNRPLDALCRYGGDEFCCLLSNTDANGTLLIANKLINAISQLEIKVCAQTSDIITLSAGVATITDSMTAFIDVVQVADEHLLAAKKDGKNTCR